MIVVIFLSSYHWDHAARSNTIHHSHHALIVRVLSPPYEVLVSHEVGAVIDHEGTILHPAGVATTEVGGQLRTVAAGLIGTTLEVPVLVENDLQWKANI